MFLVGKKELTSFPLDKLFHITNEAAKKAELSILAEAKAAHHRKVTRLIEATYASREDSYEGNEEEDYPFVGPDPDYIAGEKADARKEAFKLFSEKYALKTHASWLLPQIAAHIARMELPMIDGQVDVKSYLAQFGVDDFHKGIWTLAMHPSRGDIMQKQYTPEFRNYSALVPLLMMPHKKFNSIDYCKWPKDKLTNIVDPKLLQAMTLEFTHNYTSEQLLEIRHEALRYDSGKLKDTYRDPTTSYTLYRLSGELKALPTLAKAMMFQTWCAHPSNRTDLMILDWNNWDNMPNPLIDTNIVAAPKKTPVYSPTEDLPWYA